ncbi:MAG: zinc-binding dehydrogenase [Myxococcota bacterium]|jgi:threonine dehydrogenase-like Zn-dependent dehydrogenase|nr:zinc-binding dehydrogenase [Myxococcota bacterium]
MAEMAMAAVFTEKKGDFDLREFPVPEPRDNDMVLRVSRANVCGSDIHIWSGHTDLAAMGLRYGIILGHEMVCRVHALGARIKNDAAGQRLREGDRVVSTYYVNCGKCPPCLKGDVHMCMMSLASPVRPCEKAPHFFGAFGEYYYVKRAQKVFRVPDTVSDAVVAGANCALSQVIHGFAVAGLRMGETVVVQGAGGLGLFACAVAKEMGAGKVIIVDAIPGRLEFARRFGADEVVDMSETPDKKARTRRVMGLTGGWGADVVVEVAGVPDAIPEGLRMLGKGGRYLEMGCINPRRTCTLDPSILTGGNITLHGVSLYPPPVLKQAVDFLARTIDKYPYDELVSHTFPLSEITAAFRALDAEGGGCSGITRASILCAPDTSH